MNKVIFYICNKVHLLDLAGAVQVFYESGNYGHAYEIHFVSDQVEQLCSSRLGLFALEHFSSVVPGPGDIVIVPGYDLKQPPPDGSLPVYEWLRSLERSDTILCSICTGAFMLAKAGVLEGRECTTHWTYTDRLQKEYPSLRVHKDKVFVRSGHIYTSAGVTTGIDLALYLLEERHGADFSYLVARDLVVYMRRNGNESQESIYIKHRQHINYPVHEVQDWIIHHLREKITIEHLAGIVHTSPRNLTRLFKSATGITVGQYLEKLRLEKALHLLREDCKIGEVALECGLQSTNQLRSLLRKHRGVLPSGLRSAV